MYDALTSKRSIALVASNVIREAIITRELFFQYFSKNEGEDVSMYNGSHKEGNNFENEHNSTLYTEACKTGELSSGRP